MPESLGSTQRERKRSVAWIYYTVIAALVLLTGVTVNANGLWVWLLPALYARYLYRGGRIVVWLW